MSDMPGLSVIVGPSIRGCCYEIGQDLIDSFDEPAKLRPFIEERNGSLFFDLPNYVVQHELSGMDRSNIRLDDLRCTHCTSPKLPSYRRDGSQGIRLRSWIKKKI